MNQRELVRIVRAQRVSEENDKKGRCSVTKAEICLMFDVETEKGSLRGQYSDGSKSKQDLLVLQTMADAFGRTDILACSGVSKEHRKGSIFCVVMFLKDRTRSVL